MTDIIKYEPTNAANAWVELLAPAADLASKIASTDFVPTGMRNKPAAVAACILYGAEIGIGPMNALAKIDIVEGRPAPRAELARALALAAGHEVWVEEQTNTKVTVCGRRHGSTQVQTSTWTLDDAKKAGLAGRANWGKYPRQMLLARASAELVRMAFPDVLGGIAYFAEELDGDGPDAPAVQTAAAPVAKGNKRKLAAAPDPVEPVAEAEDIVEAEIVEDDPTVMSGPQKRMMLALFGDIAMTDRDERLKLTSAVVGREVGSANELSRDEASKLIDALNGIVEGTVTMSFTDTGAMTLAVQPTLEAS